MHYIKFISLSSLIFVSVLLTNITAFAKEVEINNTLYEQALNSYNKGQINESVIHIKNLLKENKHYLPARLLFGRILLDEGELAAAEEQYQRAIVLNADKSLVVIPLAHSLLLQNKYQVLLDTVHIDDYNIELTAKIHVFRGKAYFGLLQYDQAKNSFNNALALFPQQIEAMLGLASIALRSEDNILAEQLVAQAKSASGNSALVWFFEGEMYRRKGELAQALNAYNKTIEISPNYNDALRARISIFLDQNKLPQAKVDIDKMLQTMPEDPLTRLLKAIYLAKMKQLPQAKALLSETNYQFSQIDPEFLDQYAPVLLIYGVSLYMEEQYLLSENYLKQYLELSPSSISAREILAEIANKRNIPKKVIELLKPIGKSFLSQRLATLMLTAQLHIGDNNNAIEFYQLLPSMVASERSIKNLYAMALIKSGSGENQATAMDLLKSLNSQQSSKSIQLILGYNYMNFAMYDEALTLAKSMYNPSNNNVVELNFIGTVYLAINDDDNAEKHFTEALLKAPHDEIVKLNLMQLYIKQGKYSESETILADMLLKSPKNQNVLPLYAEVLEKQLRYKEALTSYKLLDSLNSKKLSVKYKIADLYLKTNAPDKALDMAKQINSIETFSQVGLIIKAKAYLQKQDYQNAARTLKIMFGFYLNDAERLMEIAKLQIQAKDWLAFDKTMKQLQELPTDKAQLELLSAQRLYAMGDIKAALNGLEPVIEKTAEMNSLMANLYLTQKNYLLALKFANVAYQQAEHYQNHLLLIKIHWLNGQYNQAFAQFDLWLTNNKGDWKSKRMYANLLEQQGDKKQAVYWYQEALKLAEDDIFSLNNLALLLLNDNQGTLALTTIEKAAALAPLDAKVNDTYGWVLVTLQQYEKGLKYLRESYSRDVNNARNLYHIGVVLSKLGKHDESIDMLNRAISLTKDDELLALIQAELN
jgi:putative PEP-CTERM system TPR-repeat lipoprotein